MCYNSYTIYFNYQKIVNPTDFSTIYKLDHSFVGPTIYTKAYTITSFQTTTLGDIDNMKWYTMNVSSTLGWIEPRRH